MPIRLNDDQLRKILDNGWVDVFHKLNDEEKGRLKTLVRATKSGSGLATHRWNEARGVPAPPLQPAAPTVSDVAASRRAVLQASTELGLMPTLQGPHAYESLTAPPPVPIGEESYKMMQTAGITLPGTRPESFESLPTAIEQFPGVFQPTTPTEEPSTFRRAVANIPPSAINMAKGAVLFYPSLVLSPIDTTKSLVEWVARTGGATAGSVLDMAASMLPPKPAAALRTYLRRAGTDLQAFSDQFTQDPVGTTLGAFVGAGILKKGMTTPTLKPTDYAMTPTARAREEMRIEREQDAATKAAHEASLPPTVREIQLEPPAAQALPPQGPLVEAGGLQSLYERVTGERRTDPILRDIFERARVEGWTSTAITDELRQRGYDPARYQDRITAVARDVGAPVEAPQLPSTTPPPSMRGAPEPGVDPVTGQLVGSPMDVAMKVTRVGKEPSPPTTEAPAVAPLYKHKDKQYTSLYDLFVNEVGYAQRGEPEVAMERVQKAVGGGVLSSAVEHIGDLTHRMADPNTWSTGGHEYVKEKVDKTLRWLTSEYGFLREHGENLRSNARYRGIKEEEFKANVDKSLRSYVEAHENIPTFNEAQRNAKEAAIAIGKLDVPVAIQHLEWLKKELDKGVESWTSVAHEYEGKTPSAPTIERGPLGEPGSNLTLKQVRNRMLSGDLPTLKGGYTLRSVFDDGAIASHDIMRKLRTEGFATPPEGTSVSSRWGVVGKEPTGPTASMAGLQEIYERTGPWFHSLLEGVRTIPFGATKAESWLGALEKHGQKLGLPITADEIKATGLREWLESKRGQRVTREEVAKFVEGNTPEVEEIVLSNDAAYGLGSQILETLGQKGSPPPKYAQYTLPGGTNYREVLLTTPDRSEAQALREEATRRGYGDKISEWPDKEFAERYRRIVTLAPKHEGEYTGGHFSDIAPNVIAHGRLTDRPYPLPDGTTGKMLFVEEAQSDWSWAARKGEAPPHPFGTEWYSPLLKRVLQMAAQEGYDAVGWTTGEQQAARYDLSKHVDELTLKASAMGPNASRSTWPPATRAEILDAEGPWVLTAKRGGVGVGGTARTFSSLRELESYVGKEVASKLIDKLAHAPNEYTGVNLQGVELKLGGEWAHDLYDRTIPQWIAKYTNRMGGRIGTSTLNLGKYLTAEYGEGRNWAEYHGPILTLGELKQLVRYGEGRNWNVTERTQGENVIDAMELGASFEYAVSQRGSQALVSKWGGRFEELPDKIESVHTLPITPALRAKLTRPQPLYGTNLNMLGLQDLYDRTGDLWKSATALLRARPPQGPPIAGQTAGTPALPRGKLAMFMREGGAQGQVAFDIWRRAHNQVNLMLRLVSEDTKRMFRGLDKDAKSKLYTTALGIPGRTPEGTYKYGSIVRAGIVSTKGDNPPAMGELLPDGRIVGDALPNGKWAQTYRIIWPDDAEAAHRALRIEHPEAAKVLDEMLAVEEPPIVTAAGTNLPARSLRRLQQDYQVTGLPAEEAASVADLARRALGDELAGRVIPEEFAYVPESVIRSRTMRARVRNALRPITAPSRRYKSGAAGEAVRAGEAHMDMATAVAKNRFELVKERIHNDAAARILSMVAEPLSRTERMTGRVDEGYAPFSLALFDEGTAMRRFVERHRSWFEDQGIDVPNVLSAAEIAKGRAYKIPQYILDELAPLWRPELRSTNPKWQRRMEVLDNLAGNIIGSINLWRLTRFSTATRNILSNNILSANMILRDIYRDALMAAFSKEGRIAPFAQSIADIKAIGSALTPSVRRRLPPELLGSTFLNEFEGIGPLTRIATGALRATGFNVYDVYTKRLIVEAVMDGNARQAWAVAERTGETSGLTKSAWIKRYKEGIPPEIESLAYREMDTWGGYDYWNVPKWLERLKRSKTGRAILPYPTYFYKLWETYADMFSPRSLARIVDPRVSKATRIDAMAKFMAGVTMFSLAWELVDDDGKLPEGVRESDLTADVQKFGRIKLPLTSPSPEEADWVRLYDMPILGEVMAVKAMFKHDISLTDYINDRIALGPLFNVVSILNGYSSRYNKEVPPTSQLGREMASWLPFNAELGTLRRLVDPYKRRSWDDRGKDLDNFLMGFADNYPVLSMLMPERVSTRTLEMPTYHPWETTLSYALLNTRRINEKDRDVAVALATIAMWERELKKVDTDMMREQIRLVLLPEGKTLAGQIRAAARTEDTTVESTVYKLKWGIDIKRAFMAGGTALAREQLKIAMATPDVDPRIKGMVANDLTNLVTRLAKLEKAGLAYQEFDKAPPDVQRAFKALIIEDVRRQREALSNARPQ